LVSGFSDNNSHKLTISEINLTKQTCHTKIFRNINKNSIIEFQIKLSYELWDNVFNSDSGNNVDILFNYFLNSYLRIFYLSLPIKKFNKKTNKKFWITDEIKVVLK
jgi:hypothetical protein